MNDINGYWKNDIHYCYKGHETVYQLMSGGKEFYCEECDYNGFYPNGGPDSPRKLLAEGKFDEFRARMLEELERRKRNEGIL